MISRLRDFDWALLLLVLAVCVIGVVDIYGSTVGTRFAGVYLKQVYFIVAGLVLLCIFSSIDYKLLLEAVPWLYGGAVLALAGVLLVGRAIFGSRRWVPIAGSHLQVSEFVKLVIIVVVARYFAEQRQQQLSFRDVVRLGVLVGVPMLLVLVEPDLGTALTYLPILVMGLLLGGIRWRHVAILALVGALALPVGLHFLKPYQRQRLETFARPEADPRGAGYQVMQSKIAVGSGGLRGKGIAQGSQTRGEFLPVAWTDFIMASHAEAQGFIGVLVVLTLYFLILMRLIHNAQLAPDRAGGLIVMGVVAVLAFHIAVNVGMVIGLMPVTGIPLPLMSSGGSSLLFMFAALGMVMNVRLRRFVN
jgi:rod shape determining protein RodA